jgi:hypothetical protein
MKMPTTLEKMMFGFIESQILFVCDEIKLFDYLSEQGLVECKKISKDLNLPASSLERLLVCATCIELLEKINNKYRIRADWIPYLTRRSDQYCGGKFMHYWKTSYKLFAYLKSALQENKPQWYKIDKAFSDEEALDSIYINTIYSDKTATREFLETMWASGYQDSIELCRKFSFQGYRKLIDLGGATGSFAIAALQNNNQLQAEVMDYAQVKLYAEEKFRTYQVANRASFHIGDIFNDKLPKGDVYIIGYVLSDWPESLCYSLIKKVYEYLPENGLLVILEKFFNDDKTGPYLTAMLNITMLLEMYGEHHSAKEYVTWLQRVGFTDIKIIYSLGEKHMIIGKKKKLSY